MNILDLKKQLDALRVESEKATKALDEATAKCNARAAERARALRELEALQKEHRKEIEEQKALGEAAVSLLRQMHDLHTKIDQEKTAAPKPSDDDKTAQL